MPSNMPLFVRSPAFEDLQSQELFGSGVLLAWLALAVLFRAARPQAEHGAAATYRRLLAALLVASACLALPWLRDQLPGLADAVAPLRLNVQVLATAVPAGPPGPVRSLAISPLAVVALAWFAVCVASAMRWGIARLRLSRLLARAVPAPPLIQLVVLQLARANRVREPRLLLSADAASPFSCGLLAPVIVLPTPLVETLSPEAFELVLRHELTHLRRRDPFTHAVARACAVLFALHPSLPRLMRELVIAREAAVDAEIAPSNRAAYASLLVQVASQQRFGEALAHVSMDDTALARRIAMLTHPSIEKPARGTATLGLAAAAIVALGLFAPRVLAEPGHGHGRQLAGPDPMAEHESEIDACYALAREEDPDLVIDTLARLELSPHDDFRVVAADIPTPDSPTFENCLEEKAMTWRFPPPPDVPRPPKFIPKDAKAVLQVHIHRSP